MLRKNLLAPIVGELIFGNSATRVDIDLPIFGLHSEVVAKAIQIVRLPILVSLTRMLLTLSDAQLLLAASNPKCKVDISILESQAMNSAYNNALEGIQTFKAEHADMLIWDRLGQEVYGLHKVPLLATAGEKEQNSLISILNSLSKKRD